MNSCLTIFTYSKSDVVGSISHEKPYYTLYLGIPMIQYKAMSDDISVFMKLNYLRETVKSPVVNVERLLFLKTRSIDDYI